jgi:excisionase family DNA binding protein
MTEKYHSPEEVAARFNLKPPAIRKWIREGKLKAIKFGRLWRISEAELQEFIKASEQKK